MNFPPEQAISSTPIFGDAILSSPPHAGLPTSARWPSMSWPAFSISLVGFIELQGSTTPPFRSSNLRSDYAPGQDRMRCRRGRHRPGSGKAMRSGWDARRRHAPSCRSGGDAASRVCALGIRRRSARSAARERVCRNLLSLDGSNHAPDRRSGFCGDEIRDGFSQHLPRRNNR